jgi:elongation factor G
MLAEVHRGDTVMDFLKLERERGITISAAAITFNWRTSRVNLIDTPGHIDFTIEVERAVRVLDGAVAVFDGVAGVQAQSVTVWRQAARYGVPCIAFVNKMDREGASLDAAVDAMRERLGARPLLLQVPLIRRGQLDYIVDVVTLELLRWRDVAGTELLRMPLYSATNDAAADADALSDAAKAELGSASDVAAFLQRVQTARAALVEFVAETSSSSDAGDDNDRLLDACFAELDASARRVDARALRGAIRRQLLARHATAPLLPVLCGTALRNRGIQPLLDGVLDYLPAPHERAADASALGSNAAPFCALAFKVVHDKQRGLIVWLRVLAGTLDVGQRIVNVSRRAAALDASSSSSSSNAATPHQYSHRNVDASASIERPLRLMRLDAEDTIDLSRVESGDIAAAVGYRIRC